MNLASQMEQLGFMPLHVMRMKSQHLQSNILIKGECQALELERMEINAGCGTFLQGT